ncbi:MAG: FAD-dependent thymidylate synthase [Deltaproteobacteria bacterium]|nr:FAD-dependent thymidylate synthase [Deltaproteobacteria bacterium]
MQVDLVSYTADPERVVATAARLCYSALNCRELAERERVDADRGMIARILAMGHYAVLEHASFTLAIDGVSRALSHQLVRHRLASFAQQSQRYVDFVKGFAYVTPPAIAAQPELAAAFAGEMARLADFYGVLRGAGITAEDARFILPNAAVTRLYMTMNARELRHFITLRSCRRAQWEIRELALAVLARVISVAPALFVGTGPGCLAGVCPEGEKSCGEAAAVRREFAAFYTES